MVTLGTLVIWSLSRLDNGTLCHVRMGSTGVRALVLGGTDCYYCINHMTCSTSVYYCPFIFVTIPDMLFTIMSLVYLVTLSDIRYTPCGTMWFMYMYPLHCKHSAICIPCILYFVYTQHSSMSILHAAHLHGQFYHSPLYNIFIISNWRLLWTWPDDNMLGGDGIKICHCYISTDY